MSGLSQIYDAINAEVQEDNTWSCKLMFECEDSSHDGEVHGFGFGETTIERSASTKRARYSYEYNKSK